MDRSQFTFYESFYKAAKRIKDPSERAKVYDSICEYALYGKDPDLDSLPDISAIAFELIKPNLDASRKRAESGKIGGSKKQNGSKTEAKRKQIESKFKQNGSKKEREGEKENKKEKEKEIEIKIKGESLKGENERFDSEKNYDPSELKYSGLIL